MDIFEIAASLHVPSMRPTRPGFQPLLNESSISALSFTCKRVRRLVIPILFSSIRITPGFIEEDRTEGHVRSPDMQPFVDGLRNSGSWRLKYVRYDVQSLKQVVPLLTLLAGTSALRILKAT